MKNRRPRKTSKKLPSSKNLYPGTSVADPLPTQEYESTFILMPKRNQHDGPYVTQSYHYRFKWDGITPIVDLSTNQTCLQILNELLEQPDLERHIQICVSSGREVVYWRHVIDEQEYYVHLYRQEVVYPIGCKVMRWEKGVAIGEFIQYDMLVPVYHFNLDHREERLKPGPPVLSIAMDTASQQAFELFFEHHEIYSVDAIGRRRYYTMTHANEIWVFDIYDRTFY